LIREIDKREENIKKKTGEVESNVKGQNPPDESRQNEKTPGERPKKPEPTERLVTNHGFLSKGNLTCKRQERDKRSGVGWEAR